MRRLCSILACVFAVLAFGASSSSAATPCWKTVIADWSRDNRVDGRYSPSCLRQAMQNAPTDLKIYSTLEDDLHAALQKRSSRRIAGVHVSTASIAANGGSSSASFLIALLAGLGGLVLACSVVAAIVRRR